MRNHPKIQQSSARSEDLPESIKASAHVMNLLEANLKKESDVYVRQLSIARNYTWIASLLLAVLIGLFDRLASSIAPLSSSNLQVAHLVLLGINSLAVAGAFFYSFRVSWNNLDVEYAQTFIELFQDGDDVSGEARTPEQIYLYYVAFIRAMTESYRTLCTGSRHRGKVLRRIGLTLQLSFLLLLFNITFYLMELLL